MSPFTQFLGRLVALVGAENAAQMVREFAGKTIQFPITDHYGFPVNAPILGEKRLQQNSTRDTVVSLAEACNVSLSAAIRLLKAEHRYSTTHSSNAGTERAQDPSDLGGPGVHLSPPGADPNQSALSYVTDQITN